MEWREENLIDTWILDIGAMLRCVSVLVLIGVRVCVCIGTFMNADK